MSWFLDQDQRYAHVQRFLTPYQMFCGAASGAVTKTAVAPLERVKILLQLRGMGQSIKGLPEQTHLIGVVQSIIKNEGVFALWKGNMANVIRVVPVYGLKFMFNDKFRELCKKPGQTTRDLSTLQLMASGTMGGLCQIVLTYPLELSRTRLSLSSHSLERAYTGVWDCLRHTVAKEGVTGLYKGITATIWSGGPYTGIQMTTYELIKRQLIKFPHLFMESKSLDATIARHHQHSVSPSVTQVHSHDAQSAIVHVPEFSHLPIVTAPSQSTSASQSNMIGKLTAGGLSGLISQTITYPGDTVRRRMQSNGIGGATREYSSTWDCVKKVWRKEGTRGFMRGAMTNVWRCIPGAAIQFAVWDTCMTVLGIAVD